MLKDVFAEANIHSIPAGCTGAQMGGGRREELRSLNDIKGLKFRIAGLGGSVMQKLGVVPQQIAPSDIYPALERGVIDGAEYIGPYDDEKLGFGRVTKFYYYPGFQEAGPNTDFMVNLKAWEALPKAYQGMLETPAPRPTTRPRRNTTWRTRRRCAGWWRRALSFAPIPRGSALAALYKASQELYAELGAQNARFRKIHEHWDRFRVEQVQWFRVAEDSLAKSRPWPPRRGREKGLGRKRHFLPKTPPLLSVGWPWPRGECQSPKNRGGAWGGVLPPQPCPLPTEARAPPPVSHPNVIPQPACACLGYRPAREEAARWRSRQFDARTS